MTSTPKIVLLCLLGGLISLCDITNALKCASCQGAACTNPSNATPQNCTAGQDVCLVVSACGYTERTCGIRDQHCTVPAYKQNQYVAYNAMVNSCSSVNKQLTDSDLQSGMTCCTSDNCNGATGMTATITAILICFGITIKLF